MSINNRIETKQNTGKQGYNHSKWESKRRFCRTLIRVIAMGLLIKMDRVEGLEYIPKKGPAILLINHIAFVDPIVCIHVIQRNIVPMAKNEVYNYPIIGIFPRLWGVIPVRRDEFDRRAVQSAIDVLNAGEIILVAPEGTRHPQLECGKEGVAYLGSRTGAPIIPVAIEGTIGFPAFRFTNRWQMPGVTVRFGRPFCYCSTQKRPRQEVLRKMTDEAMYLLAAMLPENRRGFYSNLSQASQETFEWY